MTEWWRDDPPAARRPVDEGLRTQSRRGKIGETWWSTRFLSALEAGSDAGRLARGRSYARSGQAISMSLSAGEVIAVVQGSRRQPYRVRVEIPPYSASEWAAVEKELAGQAIFAAALLAGDMPVEIEDVFAAAGLSLFPSSPRELQTGCSCPDYADRCKHVAAVCYLLAETFDRDPFQLLAWRGRPRHELLAGLREKRTAPERDDHRPADSAMSDDGPGVLAPSIMAVEFWGMGEELESLRLLPRSPVIAEAVLESAGPPPVAAGGWALEAALGEVYRALTRGAERLAAELGD